MATTNVKNYTTSELFTLANKIRKEQKCSQKEAFAAAKHQLENHSEKSDVMGKKLIAAMEKNNVTFRFDNGRGKVCTTIGTLRFNKVPTNRKVEGRRTKKNDDMVVFYDVRHGVYRQFNIYNVTEIVKISKK